MIYSQNILKVYTNIYSKEINIGTKPENIISIPLTNEYILFFW
ncbi:hypothetical protein CcarbDRAFT_4663 [Clostridium carboxidivorans P7]|uniref:Uncharacterized protein n=1 Tax=Clostridium carboxidivorans P7 TaxID=536227 RepID=C6Q0U6_9CLOT|nr:hypothetical protein CcarbDRAFT_4663 [Clostridium carboxidivorans P7]